jgi:hypothetical protein
MSAREFGLVFNEPVALIENLAALRALADAVPESPASDSSTTEFPVPDSSAPIFPAQDTPLQIPPEIERLRRSKDRPVSA